MKILKLLNKKNFLFIIFLIFFSNSIANEPADIWNIDKSQTEPQEDTITENIISDELSEEKISVYDLNSQEDENNENKILQENEIEDKISLYAFMILMKIIYQLKWERL